MRAIHPYLARIDIYPYPRVCRLARAALALAGATIILVGIRVSLPRLLEISRKAGMPFCTYFCVGADCCVFTHKGKDVRQYLEEI